MFYSSNKTQKQHPQEFQLPSEIRFGVVSNKLLNTQHNTQLRTTISSISKCSFSRLEANKASRSVQDGSFVYDQGTNSRCVINNLSCSCPSLEGISQQQYLTIIHTKSNLACTHPLDSFLIFQRNDERRGCSYCDDDDVMKIVLVMFCYAVVLESYGKGYANNELLILGKTRKIK